MTANFPRRITKPTVAIAMYLLSLEGKATYGLEIGRSTGLGSASVYAVLDRLEQYGWLESEWEADSGRKGARRRLYKLTEIGTTESNRLTEESKAKIVSISIKNLATGLA